VGDENNSSLKEKSQQPDWMLALTLHIFYLDAKANTQSVSVIICTIIFFVFKFLIFLYFLS